MSTTTPISTHLRRRGAAAILAMVYLVLFTTLATAMLSLSVTNNETAVRLADADRARAAAESGMRWVSWRITKMSRPVTRVGTISASVANSLWPSIRSSIAAEFGAFTTPGERGVTVSSTSLVSSSIATGADDGKFTITVRQHPLAAGDALDQRYLRVTSTGTYRQSVRSVSMDFLIDKKVKFAVVGKVPIQLGRNTLVEGSVAMATTLQPSGQPPLLSISDFRGLTTNLTNRIDAFRDFLKNNYSGYDNRITATSTDTWSRAVSAGFTDVSGDGCIDEYDLFLKEFDSNRDKKITASEFTNPSTGKLYDDSLMTVIDNLGGPLFSGDVIRSGYKDGTVSNADDYAKVRGQVLVAETSDSLISRLAANGQKIQDVLQGPIAPLNPADAPVKFGSGNQVFDLSPSNFDTLDFRNQTGTAAGTTSKTATVIQNAVLSAADANGGTSTEKTPYGSTSYQATYKRPVFKNVTFKNCRIPKGLNALFQNCTFQGTTFVETEPTITVSGRTATSPSDGMTWAKQMKSGSFTADTVLSTTNSYGFDRGNNIRFDGCTFQGPLAQGGPAGEAPTAYTHFANSWEFTGATMFSNQVDQTATIVAPQTNIEMGSFTDPAGAPSTLVGVVVAGNIDIRGSSFVDGSIIVSGDGAGNTTLGWFGSSDSSTNPGAMPEGGFGRLLIRYNPNRALPNGISIPVDISPDLDTYSEAAP